SWTHHGTPIEAPQPGKLLPEMELRLQPMPTEVEWTAAVRGAAELFGLSGSPFLTPPAVATLSEPDREKSKALTGAAQRLVGEVERAYGRLGLSTDAAGRTADRLATARTAAALVNSLQHQDGVQLVRRLGEAIEDGRGTALGTSLAQADQVAGALS